MILTERLLRLQTLDLEWDEKGALYQAAKQELTDQSPLEKQQAQQHQLQEGLSQARAHLRNTELEIASLRHKATQVEQNLYSGSVISPRELENLKQESEQLARRLVELEESALTMMAEVEKLEASAKQGAQDLAIFERKWAQRRQRAARLYQQLRARLQKIQSERGRMRSTLGPADLALYDELRKIKNGKVMSPMSDDRCQTCQVSVPSNKSTQVRSGDQVIVCEGCGRILYRA